MAKLGVKTVDELVGRTDLLKRKDKMPSARAEKVDLGNILGNPYAGVKLAGYTHKQPYDFKLEETLVKMFC